MKSPLISVVIPLYNKEKIVARTIHSVLSQSFRDVELIIINDGSTDGSMDVVRAIHDDRIVLVEQENGGPSAARNTGTKKAKAEWIVFLDADDELMDGALEHLLGLARKYPQANIIDGSFIVKTYRGKQNITYDDVAIQNNYKAFFYRKTLPSTGHTLFKKDLLKRHSYDTHIRRYEDVELIMRLLKDAHIVTTSTPIFQVNTSFSSASSARSSISEDFLGHLDFKGKSFWEYMALYQFYLGEREHYPLEVRRLYPLLHRRYDLLLLYKMLLFLKKIHVL